jgi:hypothetical protein
MGVLIRINVMGVTVLIEMNMLMWVSTLMCMAVIMRMSVSMHVIVSRNMKVCPFGRLGLGFVSHL